MWRFYRKPPKRVLSGKANHADAVYVSAARHEYSLPKLAVSYERRWKAEVSLVGIALSTAAIWIVLLPAIHEKPASMQTCEVVLLANGSAACANLAAPANAVSKPKP
jgi:uncharacterized membrane protein